ncbi:MAG: NADP-dependent oxidoreductase [Betaproteobacteria bacterium PRO3]|nr:NADP-dependent oxidoreductase [Betaproteobacteria bacterium PRO3]
MGTRTNRRVALARIPQGEPQPADFALVEDPSSEIGAGEVLLRTIWLSMDPYQRNWMAGARNYGTAARPGATVIGRAVSEVVSSNDRRFAPGDIVCGETGWQTHAVAPADALESVDATLAPISTALGVLGAPGLTAWVGMADLGQPRSGETVVVSAAAGAVGSVAGQLARIFGARVVGVAGDPRKCRHVVEDLGFHACVSHRDSDVGAALARECPGRVDLHFDNTGGPVTDAVYGLLARDARIVLCGLVAEYGAADARGHDLRPLLAAQATLKAFSVRRNLHRMTEWRRRGSEWIREGALVHREDVVRGIERAPEAFLRMLSGQSIGKALVQVAEDPSPR